MTYTYAILEISQAAYDEIRAKLAAAGYSHAFHDDGSEVIDMHGIAVRAPERPDRCHCGHLESVHRHPSSSRARICLESSCACRLFTAKDPA